MLDFDYRIRDKGFKSYRQNCVSLRMMSPTLNLQLRLAGSPGNPDKNVNLWYYEPICRRRSGQLSQLAPLNRLLPTLCFQTASTCKQLDGLSAAVQPGNNAGIWWGWCFVWKMSSTCNGWEFSPLPGFLFFYYLESTWKKYAAVFLKLQITSKQNLLNNSSRWLIIIHIMA